MEKPQFHWNWLKTNLLYFIRDYEKNDRFAGTNTLFAKRTTDLEKGRFFFQKEQRIQAKEHPSRQTNDGFEEKTVLLAKRSSFRVGRT